MKGAKTCSRCKAQHYCGKECQTKDWKRHKKHCTASGKIYDKDMIDGMIQDFHSILNGHFHLMLNGPKIPKYHEEFEQVYPGENLAYERLKSSWIQSGKYHIHSELEYGTGIFSPFFQKRWGPNSSYHYKELQTFLSREDLEPGDILEKILLHGVEEAIEPYKCNQSMRNSTVQPQQFIIGETYIAIGFVDIFPLVTGSFVSEDEHNEHKLKPMNYLCYDKCPIPVARSMVLYQMMVDGVSIDSILQAWFSTGWSKKTLSDYQSSCSKVLKYLDPSKDTDLSISRLLTHWMKTTLKMDSVQYKWTQFLQESRFEPLANLQYEKDRVDYARYLITGHIFGNNKEDYTYGNPTMFSLPQFCSDFHLNEENFFATLAMDFLDYKSSLLVSVTQKVKTGLQELIQHIKRGSVVCRFSVEEFNIHNKEILKNVKALDAAQIDWSNIPDYLDLNNFFDMAKACDGSKTIHTPHYMNWMYYVFGTNLIDFPNMKEMAQIIDKERQEGYRNIRDNRQFLRQDRYIEYCMNSALAVLSTKYRQKFVDFVFRGQNVEVTEPLAEVFNPFARVPCTFSISFNFR